MPKGGNGGGGNSGNIIKGNKRDNVLTGTENDDIIQGLDGNDRLSGLAGDDFLEGGNGADLLEGGLGSDTLLGGSGDDRLDGGKDNDTVDGGDGTDTAVLTGVRDAYTVVQIDANTVEISGPDGTDTFTSVEFFEFSDLTQTLAEIVEPRVANLSLDAANYLPSTDNDLNGGATVEMSFQVSNTGNVNASGFEIITVLSKDGAVSADDVTIGTTSASFAPGETVTFTASYGVDASLPAGQYKVISYLLWDPLPGEADPADDVAVADANLNFVGGTTYGTEGDDTFTALSVDETFLMGGGDDTINVRGGQDVVDGGTGTDTAVFTGRREDYTVEQIDPDTIAVTGDLGTTTFRGVEVFDFTDVDQSATDVVAPAELDLSVSAFSVSDTVIGPGETTLISWTVEQDGVVRPAPSQTQLVIATAPDMGSVTEVLTTRNVFVNNQGDTDTFTATLDGNALAPGTYYVAAVADSGNVLAESDEADNISGWTEITVEAPLANMTLDSVVIEPTSVFDFNGVATADITVTFTNTGNVDITNRVNVQLFISEDENGTFGEPDDWLGAAWDSDGVAVGETVSVTVSRKIDEGMLDGTYNLVADLQISISPDDDLTDNTIVLTDAITLTRDMITGTAGDDVIGGSDDRAETIQLGDGNDILLASRGSDVMDGGGGFDTADFSGYNGPLELGTNRTYVDGGLSVAPGDYYSYAGHNEMGTLIGFEKLIGSSFNDTLYIYSDVAGPSAGITEVDGGAGDDVIFGDWGDETLNGGDGNDVLGGFYGNDFLTGGAGADVFVFERYEDPYYGFVDGQGDDVITDFDPLLDIIGFTDDPFDGIYDPFADMIETAEGVLIQYADNGSVLVQGVVLADLNAQNVVTDDGGLLFATL